jgi:hypothetical protein
LTYQREECEEQIDKLVYEFNVQQHLAPEGVIGRPNLPEVEQRIDGSKEGTIEPSSTLRNEFRNRV